MEVLAGPFFIVALVVAIGGAAKVVAPHPTVRALRAVGLPGRVPLVYAMGASEMALGSIAVAYGGSVSAALVAVAYLAFAAFVFAALRTGGVASCGCFGQAETPPSVVHVVVNLASAAVAGAAAGTGDVRGFTETAGDLPLAGVPFVVLVAVGVYLVHALLTVVPSVLAAAGPSPSAASEFRLLAPVPVAPPRRRVDP